MDDGSLCVTVIDLREMLNHLPRKARLGWLLVATSSVDQYDPLPDRQVPGKRLFELLAGYGGWYCHHIINTTSFLMRYL